MPFGATIVTLLSAYPAAVGPTAPGSGGGGAMFLFSPSWIVQPFFAAAVRSASSSAGVSFSVGRSGPADEVADAVVVAAVLVRDLLLYAVAFLQQRADQRDAALHPPGDDTASFAWS